MTEAEKKMKKYVNAVERRLNLPLDLKARVMSDFASSIAARREAGETDEEIYASLGTPRKAAAELNEQMKDFAYRKSPWRFVCLAVAVGSGLWLAFYAGLQIFGQLFIKNQGGASMGIIGGADGPTAIFVATTVGFNWDMLIVAAVLIFSTWGFLRLRKCRGRSN